MRHIPFQVAIELKQQKNALWQGVFLLSIFRTSYFDAILS
jgi:hypothetical protein